MKRAYELVPAPAVLWEIGRAFEELHYAGAAVCFYRAYLQTGPSDAEEAERAIVRVEKRTASKLRAEARKCR